MSINITKKTDSTASANTMSNSIQPRDERGRFVSSESTNLSTVAKEVKMERVKSLYMEEIESSAPYVYNFVKDNGVVRTLIKDGNIRSCLYLNKGTDSYYLFIASHNSFGFHLDCGVLTEVLNNEDTVKLISDYDILHWDAIQKI